MTLLPDDVRRLLQHAGVGAAVVAAVVSTPAADEVVPLRLSHLRFNSNGGVSHDV